MIDWIIRFVIQWAFKVEADEASALQPHMLAIIQHVQAIVALLKARGLSTKDATLVASEVVHNPTTRDAEQILFDLKTPSLNS